MSDPGWVRVATLRTAEAFRRHLQAGGIALDFDETLLPPAESPFRKPLEADGLRAGNRFCILPMEGWDGTPTASRRELTERRWRHFGASGAKLIWGGEAVAVRHDGRANPNQLLMTTPTQRGARAPARGARRRARERFGRDAATTCSSACSSRTPAASQAERQGPPRAARSPPPPAARPAVHAGVRS